MARRPVIKSNLESSLKDDQGRLFLPDRRAGNAFFPGGSALSLQLLQITAIRRP